MSKINDFLIERIEELCKKTGYAFDFLMGIWNECMEEGASWDFFAAVTLELDW